MLILIKIYCFLKAVRTEIFKVSDNGVNNVYFFIGSGESCVRLHYFVCLGKARLFLFDLTLIFRHSFVHRLYFGIILIDRSLINVKVLLILGFPCVFMLEHIFFYKTLISGFLDLFAKNRWKIKQNCHRVVCNKHTYHCTNYVKYNRSYVQFLIIYAA